MSDDADIQGRSDDIDYIVGVSRGERVLIPAKASLLGAGKTVTAPLVVRATAAQIAALKAANTPVQPGALAMDGVSLLGFIDGAGDLQTVARRFTWATLPAAADYIGTAIVSDIGARGSLWQSDGAAWGLVGGACVLERSAVASAAHTGTTSDTTIRTIALPAGIMGLNGAIEVQVKWSLTNNANGKTCFMQIGGSTWNGVGMGGSGTFGIRGLLENRNSAASQLGSHGTNSGYSGGNATWSAPTVDTSAATSITISIQLANAGDSATLESYMVTLLRP